MNRCCVGVCHCRNDGRFSLQLIIFLVYDPRRSRTGETEPLSIISLLDWRTLLAERSVPPRSRGPSVNQVSFPLADRERHVPEQGERAAREERLLSSLVCVALPNGTSHHPHLWGKDRWRRAVWWATPPPTSQQPEHVASSLHRHHDCRWVGPWGPPLPPRSKPFDPTTYTFIERP